MFTKGPLRGGKTNNIEQPPGGDDAPFRQQPSRQKWHCRPVLAIRSLEQSKKRGGFLLFAQFFPKMKSQGILNKVFFPKDEISWLSSFFFVCVMHNPEFTPSRKGPEHCDHDNAAASYFEQFVQKTLEIVIKNIHFVHNFM